MSTNIDILIAGAGPVGCTAAQQLATLKGLRCLIVDQRSHLAGNCFDRHHESGVLIHQYGPHYFRSNSKELIDYLSQFTEWIPGNYLVNSLYQKKLYPFPINLDTLELFFNQQLNATSAQELLKQLAVPVSHADGMAKNSEEFVRSRVGDRLYEAFYLNYTLKQWEKHPRELDPSVCGRIPIRLNRDCRYVDHTYQLTPKNGFTELFKRMTDHELIEIKLNTSFEEIKNKIIPKVATIYTGPIDSYFGNALGKLQWRSLHFEFQHYQQSLVQPVVQINYPEAEYPYTRTVEIKHVTQQQHAHTVISYEYPRAQGDPYYPMPTAEEQQRYQQYRQLAEKEQHQKSVYFAGRLAEYKYINTDEAIERGQRIALEIINKL